MLWEALDDEEKKDSSAGHYAKSHDKDREKVIRAEASDARISLKRTPAAAWVVSCDPKKEYDLVLGIKNGVPLVPLHSRLKPFRYLFMCFGVDITGNQDPKVKLMYQVIRCTSLLFYTIMCALYWVQTFLAVKYNYLEYGAALVHLVVASALVSLLVTHGIVNSRSDQLVQLLRKIDTINAALPIKIMENKMALVAFLCSLTVVSGITFFPLKYVVGNGIQKREIDLATKKDGDPDDFAFNVHYVCNLLIANYLSIFLVSFGLLWDLTYLTFFIVMAKRYYMVFRNSYFVMLLNKPTKQYEAMTIMQEFRQHHFTICGVVELMDEIFSPMILIWYVMLTVCMCCWIRAFDTQAFNSLSTGFIVISCLALTFGDFYALSRGTSLINDEMNAHLDTVRTMCIREDTPTQSSIDNFQERISHLSYITCILASPVAITGWGFFSISKGFVLTVSSTVLTFTLVLYGI